MALPKTPLLEERVKQMQAEIDAFIDERVAEIKRHCENQPLLSIRHSLVGTGCLCSAYLQLKAKEA